MVLDVKAMNWAAQNDLDTAKLKAARVRIYGKWYYPELPADTTMLNLQTGERATFPEGMVAGEVIWVAERDLKKARLGPYTDISDEDLAALDRPALDTITSTGLREDLHDEEPYLAMARVPPPPVATGPKGGMAARHAPDLVPITHEDAPAIYDTGDGSNIHLPLPSIAPLVLGFGISIAVLGAVVHPLILLVGLVWTLVGAIGWIRIGLLEERAAAHSGTPHG